MAGVSLLKSFHPVIYVFGAVLLYAAVRMMRGSRPVLAGPGRVLRMVGRVLPTTGALHGQRFVVRDPGRGPRAVTTDTFVVYTSNVFALPGMRALYFLLAGAAARFRYLQSGLAVILAAVAVKLLTADLFEVPAWASPAFIALVLAVVAVLSLRDHGARGRPAPRGFSSVP